ncbi:MAG TPA: methyl-accepting chemotaxis protein [Gemmatimonadaceae bacterium]|nr:methyl-accepting chemotaxis protein [Gemmatimonadaceae bacterium]
MDIAHKRATVDADTIALGRSVRSVQRRIVAGGGTLALVLVAALAFVTDHWMRNTLAGLPLEKLHDAETFILLGAAVMLGIVELALIYLSRYVSRRVTEPAALLAEAAERVAAGDLAVDIAPIGEDDELGRLGRATGGMIAELRRLVRILRESAQQTAAQSAEITAGTEQMSTAAGEMAHTSSELSSQAADMAQSIARTAADATTLSSIADQLSAGAHEGVERNDALRALARANRAGLDASEAALGMLAAEAESSATAAADLVDAFEQIRSFVTLVRRMARQSKLLALNASMEAARAGQQGEGFAVVASEIRKLSANSNQAAERTEDMVTALLEKVELSRESSRRTASTVAGVRAAIEQALTSFAEVESAVAGAEGWTRSIEQAANQSRELVAEATIRLEHLAHGTESFAAAMEQVAASTEQQSAGAQEIAAASAALADASRKLLAQISAFRLDEIMLPPELVRRRSSGVVVQQTLEILPTTA